MHVYLASDERDPAEDKGTQAGVPFYRPPAMAPSRPVCDLAKTM
jgi:hypothetical protein